VKSSITRREFGKKTVMATSIITLNPGLFIRRKMQNGNKIYLGGQLFEKYDSPDGWVNLLRKHTFNAALCPVDVTADSKTISAYREAAEKSNIIISEVGIWRNPLSPDEDERNKALDSCIKGLVLADEIKACCCVNISGSRNRQHWAGPHKDNLTDETFEMVVETTRKVIDAVNPLNTWFTLEAMPWAFPFSPDSYLRLIKAIDRQRFAVHLDPVNMITSPEIYFNNASLIKESFQKLGPYIKSCHAKDIILREDIYTPHLDETRPGLGVMDYSVFLNELSKLDKVPLMMEHLSSLKEYRMAAEYIRSVGNKNGIII